MCAEKCAIVLVASQLYMLLKTM